MSNYQDIIDLLTERDWIGINQSEDPAALLAIPKAAADDIPTWVSGDWTEIQGAVVATTCDTIPLNFRDTEAALGRIMGNARGFVSLCYCEPYFEIRINTLDRQELAPLIVDEVRHYFSTHGLENQTDQDIILGRVARWAERVKAEPTIWTLTPEEYKKFVLDGLRYRDDIPVTLRFLLVYIVKKWWTEHGIFADGIGMAAPAQYEEQPYYYNIHKRDALTTVFQRLQDGHFVAADASLDAWLIICGAETEKRLTTRLCWLGDYKTLAYMITNYIGLADQDRKWEIARKCFDKKGGKDGGRINIQSLKNALSKAKRDPDDEDDERPASFDEIDDIFKVTSVGSNL